MKQRQGIDHSCALSPVLNHYQRKTASQSLALVTSEQGQVTFITSEAGAKDEANLSSTHKHTYMHTHTVYRSPQKVSCREFLNLLIYANKADEIKIVTQIIIKYMINIH